MSACLSKSHRSDFVSATVCSTAWRWSYVHSMRTMDRRQLHVSLFFLSQPLTPLCRVQSLSEQLRKAQEELRQARGSAQQTVRPNPQHTP